MTKNISIKHILAKYLRSTMVVCSLFVLAGCAGTFVKPNLDKPNAAARAIDHK